MAAAAILLIVFFAGTSIVMVCEDVRFAEATSTMIPAFLGELGRVEGHSIITQISILVALLSSVAFLAVITGRITSRFVELCRAGGSIVKQVNYSDHIVICGWNFQGQRIIDELMRSQGRKRRQVVILANRDTRPVPDERLAFVQGDPTQDEALLRAGIPQAESAIILSDMNKPANEADSEALMIILAVESLNRNVHSCVQVMNSANRVHFERAHADEVICLDQLGGTLAAASALNHGTSQVIAELLTSDAGSELYRLEPPLPESLHGKEFSEAARILGAKRIVLVGLETGDGEDIRKGFQDDIAVHRQIGDRVVILNPQKPYMVRPDDALFVIAESEPAGI
ncbi:MAG: NAD-binding protein [Phycisphaerales bacterium]